MKHYQDPDPLHGHGKAIPHPKIPTSRKATKISMKKFQDAMRAMKVRFLHGIKL